MITIFRRMALGGVLAVVAVGLAAPASADPLAGTYTATVTGSSDSGGFGPPPLVAGDQMTWVLTPCGSDCTHLEVPDRPKHSTDLHLQGGSWSGENNALGCTKTIDLSATTASESCRFWTIQYAVTKNG